MRLHIHTLVMASLAAHALGMDIGSDDHQHQKKDPDADTHVTPTPNATATTATAATSSTPTTTPTHTIAVGATGHTFTPNNLTVAAGTVIEFNFYPGNHSVVRSAYKFPCIPYEDTGANLVGFFSGFENTNVYSTDGPKYRILVNDTNPIFYYCSAPSSCIDNGMIGVINPNATWTLETQQAYAANTTIQLSPGDPLPSEVAPPSSTTATSPVASDKSHGHSVGAIVGIAVGVVAAGLAVLALTGWCCLRHHPYLQRRLRARRQQSQSLGQYRTKSDDQDDKDARGHGHSHPLSPMTPSTRQGTPGSASSMFLKYGSSPPPPGGATHRGLPPSMADMSEYLSQPNYRHRTPPPVPPVPPMPPMAQIAHQMPYAHIPYHLPHHQQPHQPHTQHYYPGLPIYSHMSHMSPLQSHPFYDKVYPPPAPVELPTAVALSANVAIPARSTSSARHQREYASNYTVNSGMQDASATAESRSPPPMPEESPTIGGAAGSSWGKGDDDSQLRI